MRMRMHFLDQVRKNRQTLRGEIHSACPDPEKVHENVDRFCHVQSHHHSEQWNQKQRQRQFKVGRGEALPRMEVTSGDDKFTQRQRVYSHSRDESTVTFSKRRKISSFWTHLCDVKRKIASHQSFSLCTVSFWHFIYWDLGRTKQKNRISVAPLQPFQSGNHEVQRTCELSSIQILNRSHCTDSWFGDAWSSWILVPCRWRFDRICLSESKNLNQNQKLLNQLKLAQIQRTKNSRKNWRKHYRHELI